MHILSHFQKPTFHLEIYLGVHFQRANLLHILVENGLFLDKIKEQKLNTPEDIISGTLPFSSLCLAGHHSLHTQGTPGKIGLKAKHVVRQKEK